MKRQAALVAGLAVLTAGPASAQEGFRIVAGGLPGWVLSPARVTFSEPPAAAATPGPVASIPGVRVSPPIPGQFSWADSVTLLFTPGEPFRTNSTYRLSFDTTFRSARGTAIGTPRNLSFGLRFEPPTAHLVESGGPIELRFRTPGGAPGVRVKGTPRGITLDPALPGRWSWTDSLTLRFAPAARLAPRQVVQITIDSAFRGLRGEQLPPGLVTLDVSRTVGVYHAEFPRAAEEPVAIFFQGGAVDLAGLRLPPRGITIAPFVMGQWSVVEPAQFRFQPERWFWPLTRYVVTIDTSFRDARGTPMDTTWTASFEHRAQLLNITSLPVTVRDPIDLSFTRPLQVDTGAGRGLPEGIEVEPAIEADVVQPSAQVLRLVPRRPLVTGQKYRVAFTREFMARAGTEPEPRFAVFTPGHRLTVYSMVNSPWTPIEVSFGPAGPPDTATGRLPRGMTLEPATPGRVVWRSGRLRFEPTAPWRHGVEYTLGIDTSYRARDGTGLLEPVVFQFHGPAPRVEQVWMPSGRLLPGGPMRLVTTAPVDAESLLATYTLEPGEVGEGFEHCAALHALKLRVVENRPATPDDNLGESGGGWGYPSSAPYSPDSLTRSLRRIITLEVPRALPLGCSGTLAGQGPVVSFRTPGVVVPSADRHGPQRTRNGLPVLDTAPPLLLLDRDRPLYIATSEPVDEAELRRHLSLTPEIPFSLAGAWAPRSPELWELRASLTPGRTYQLRFRRGLRPIVGLPLGTDVVWTIQVPAAATEAARLEPVQRIVGRGDEVRIPLAPTTATGVERCALVVPESRASRLIGEGWWNRLGQVVEGQVAGWQCARMALPALPGGGARPALLPLPPGVRAGSGELLVVKVTATGGTKPPEAADLLPSVVQATDLGAEVRHWPGATAVRVRDRRTGAPRPGARVRVRDCTGDILAQATTGRGGIARIAGPLPEGSPDGSCGPGAQRVLDVRAGNDRLWIALPGVFARDPVSWPALGWDSLETSATVLLDRPAYAADESLHAVILAAHQRDGETQRAAAGITLDWEVWAHHDFRRTLKVRAEERGVINTLPECVPKRAGSITLDEAGSAVLTLPLAGLEPGAFRLILRQRRGNALVSLAWRGFTVGRYRTARLLATIGSREDWVAGDTTEVVVEARDRADRPAVGATVNWRGILRFLTRPRYGPGIPGYTVGGPEPFSYNGEVWDTTIVVGTARVGADGAVRIPVVLPGFPSRHRYDYTMTATVTDSAGDSLRLTLTRAIYPTSLQLGLRRLDSLPDRAGRMRVEVKATDLTGRPVSGARVTLQGTRPQWWPDSLLTAGGSARAGGWSRVALGKCDVVTAADGRARCRRAVGPGARGLSASTRDREGRPVETWRDTLEGLALAEVSQPVAVGGRHRIRRDALTVLPTDSARVGDTLRLVVTNPFRRARAWLTVGRFGPLADREWKITRSRDTLRVAVTPEMAPGVELLMTLVDADADSAGSAAESSTRWVKISDPARDLQVTLAWQGEADWHRLEVRDAAGDPVQARVVGWRLDPRILAFGRWTPPAPGADLTVLRGHRAGLASSADGAGPRAYISNSLDDRPHLGFDGRDDFTFFLDEPPVPSLFPNPVPAVTGIISPSVMAESRSDAAGRAELAFGSGTLGSRLVVIVADARGRTGSLSVDVP